MRVGALAAGVLAAGVLTASSAGTGGSVSRPDLPLVPPDGALPSGEECAERVVRDPWEPRPENATANGPPDGPPPYGMGTWYSDEADGPAYRGRVDGAYSGTTDEILQWAACTWGFPADLARAQAYVETRWRQSFVGDGGESFGLFQMRDPVWGGHPASVESTAFVADWAMGLLRACYDGAMWYPHLRGDLDACIGVHFSGDPDPATWRDYTAEVRRAERERPWLSWPSEGGTPPVRSRFTAGTGDRPG